MHEQLSKCNAAAAKKCFECSILKAFSLLKYGKAFLLTFQIVKLVSCLNMLPIWIESIANYK